MIDAHSVGGSDPNTSSSLSAKKFSTSDFWTLAAVKDAVVPIAAVIASFRPAFTSPSLPFPTIGWVSTGDAHINSSNVSPSSSAAWIIGLAATAEGAASASDTPLHLHPEIVLSVECRLFAVTTLLTAVFNVRTGSARRGGGVAAVTCASMAHSFAAGAGSCAVTVVCRASFSVSSSAL
jgi:hypothetical protein